MAEIRSTVKADRHFYAYDNIPETDLGRDTNATKPHARRMMSMVGRLVKHSVLIRQSTKDVSDTFRTSHLGGDMQVITSCGGLISNAGQADNASGRRRQNLTVLDGPALYRAHIDNLVGTLSDEDVSGGTIEELHQIIVTLAGHLGRGVETSRA
ncbi:hypothetical protein ACP2AV_15470 [Aliiroseovarius sp. PTFE2010]|uniref:hypothetical protein n=1 Tax=Aliiroseovarius sp. PTFE2010 TaxID=3417190 RepID=UPI003CEC2CA7